jgi:hypothetical protein
MAAAECAGRIGWRARRSTPARLMHRIVVGTPLEVYFADGWQPEMPDARVSL